MLRNRLVRTLHVLLSELLLEGYKVVGLMSIKQFVLYHILEDQRGGLK